jgi:pyridoxal 5'-phosphate synthase pdxT subunit
MRIGVLALQGGFSLHQERLEALDAEALLVKKAEEIPGLDGLIIPGGESTTLLKLADSKIKKSIIDYASSGLPIFATCAGLIFLAKKVENPSQESLGIIDIDVKRNAYGRQVDSFIAPQLSWTTTGKNFLKVINKVGEQNSICEAVFIRAPKIIRTGSAVEVLMNHDNDPILIRQGNVLGATFHPELSAQAMVVHQGFVALCQAARQ